MLRTAVIVLALTGTALAGPGEPRLPADARLDRVRAELEARLARVTSAGLPADLLLNKVREGLAKNVEAKRIAAVTVRLADSLEAAQGLLLTRRPGPLSPALLRAVTEARMAGIELGTLEVLLAAGRADEAAARGVQVLLELELRGYPVERSVILVDKVAARDPVALDRLPGLLESMRREEALSHGESVDALVRGLATSDSLAGAYKRAVEDERRKGNGRGGRKAEETDVSRGNSTSAPGRLPKIPPGQIKK